MNRFVIPVILLFVSHHCFGEPPLPPKPGKLPNDLVLLKQSYQQDVQKAIKPITERYIASLRRLLDQTTRAGALEDALAIKTELDSVVAGAAASTETVSRFYGKWTMKVETSSFPRILKANGVMETPRGKSDWKVEGGKLMLKSTDDGWDSFDLPGQRDKLEGKTPTGLDALLFR